MVDKRISSGVVICCISRLFTPRGGKHVGKAQNEACFEAWGIV